MIWEVRDPVTRPRSKGKKTAGDDDKSEEAVVDEGEKDKRLFVVEEEFASPLRIMEREGNILSPTIRQAWDDGNLRILTKHSPAKATGAHISIIGHITRDELRRYLSATESANGFANRFLFVCVKRSKILPEGGKVDEVKMRELQKEIVGGIQFGRNTGKLVKSEAAKKFWAEIYENLSEGKPGLFGAVTSRAEAQVMRLAAIYAVLDKSKQIKRVHLKAALAVWKYCENSVRYIFGDATGDFVADRIMDGLQMAREGLTRTEISALFSRNVSAERIEGALSGLEKSQMIKRLTEETGGRPTQRWAATK